MTKWKRNETTRRSRIDRTLGVTWDRPESSHIADPEQAPATIEGVR